MEKNDNIKDNIENKIELLKKEYLKTLKPIELIALNIAKKNLETSFSLEKSIGFLDYIKKINDENEKK
tara:strand:+ start:107 stop:310 length:204 start_codon:yes stop_codon:yes gene_type:complete